MLTTYKAAYRRKHPGCA